MNKLWLVCVLVAVVTAHNGARNILDDDFASNHANQQITDEDIEKFFKIYLVIAFVMIGLCFVLGLFLMYRCFQKRKMSRAIKEQMKLRQYEYRRMAHLPLSQVSPLVLHL